jgi:hypothetical protein
LRDARTTATLAIRRGEGDQTFVARLSRIQ